MAVLWIICYIAVLELAHGSLPFDRPAAAQGSFAMQIAAPTIGLVEIIVLMALAFILTSKRAIPDMAARAPERRVEFCVFDEPAWEPPGPAPQGLIPRPVTRLPSVLSRETALLCNIRF
jgi:hypothetical protein